MPLIYMPEVDTLLPLRITEKSSAVIPMVCICAGVKFTIIGASATIYRGFSAKRAH